VPRTARDVVFVDGVRTPFGKAGPTGLYAETRADDMIVSVIRELLRRNPALPLDAGHRARGREGAEEELRAGEGLTRLCRQSPADQVPRRDHR
jgi:acetyl-CoA acetyltransferase